MKELLAALSACMKLTAAVGLLFLVGAAGAPVGVWVGMAVLFLALLPTLPRRDPERHLSKERSA
jgi:Flp pilus assembly protein TadB